jgi:hypothetical protein
LELGSDGSNVRSGPEGGETPDLVDLNVGADVSSECEAPSPAFPERQESNVTAIDTALPSLTIVKRFKYRGEDEDWSNTYFMTGDLPTSPASWKTLADAAIAEEVALYDSSVSVIKAIGHEAGQSVAVWSYDYLANSATTPGTFATSGGVIQSGDTAGWLRWSTDQLTSKGKPIYLRSYFHPAYTSTGVDGDTVMATWITAAEEYGTDWVAGFVDGDGVTHHRAGPHGVVGLVPQASPFATTRTLERRGKRKRP